MEDLSFGDEESTYSYVLNIAGDAPERKPGELAPIIPPHNPSKSNGLLMVVITIPKSSKAGYFTVVKNDRTWFEAEMLSEQTLGYESEVTFNPLFHYGKFSSYLLDKIRRRPEVGVIIADSLLERC